MPNSLGIPDGWISDGGHERYARDLPVYRPASRGLASPSKPTKPILLYKAWRMLGGYPGYGRQTIGDCTSMGTGHGTDLLESVETVRGERTAPRETCTEAIYAIGRELAHMLGPPGERGDGCYGAAVVKGMLTVGMVSREMLGDARAYSGTRAGDWGWHGLPADLKAKAASYRLANAAKITDEVSAISCLWNGSPFIICSSQAFTMTRDADGFCRAVYDEEWGHCMMVAAWRPPPREGYLICQSWGPTTPSGPTDLDQPSFSFWCEPRVMHQHILSKGDSWGLFGAPDFAPTLLPGEFYRA